MTDTRIFFQVTIAMIRDGEVSDDDLNRLGLKTIGDRANMKRLAREAKGTNNYHIIAT